MERKIRETLDEANLKAVEKIMNSQPILVDIRKAIEVIPGMNEKTILHAGPPIDWERMCGPMKGAVIGALIYEGLAESPEKAKKLAESGEIRFSPTHHHNAVGPMAGIISPSMPVFVVKNMAYGNFAYCNMNEGLGKVLRFGAYSEDVVQKLKWMEKTLAPALRAAVKESNGINLKNIIAQALHMGDECHNRNVAATSLFLRLLTPLLLRAEIDKESIHKVFEFISGNDHFFLNLSMASSKATMDSADGIENSTVVTVMARNGTDFGIRVSGIQGVWFTAPAPKVKGLYFPGFSEQDANPDLGDSTISETAGIGGFAMAAAPAIVQFVGGSPTDAINYAREMKEIVIAKHKHFTIPIMNFEGTPTGIDIRKVVEKGITPIINTGIAHKEAGIGQIGAGIVRAPMECFIKALESMAEKLGL
ncbi:MAG: DUF1116 domain-containing protein [Candidatus Bathyarchaeia archaeon]